MREQLKQAIIAFLNNNGHSLNNDNSGIIITPGNPLIMTLLIPINTINEVRAFIKLITVLGRQEIENASIRLTLNSNRLYLINLGSYNTDDLNERIQRLINILNTTQVHIEF